MQIPHEGHRATLQTLLLAQCAKPAQGEGKSKTSSPDLGVTPTSQTRVDRGCNQAGAQDWVKNHQHPALPHSLQAFSGVRINFVRVGWAEALGWCSQGLPAQGAQRSLAVTLTSWITHNIPKAMSIAIRTPCQMRKGLFYFPLV